MHWKPAWWMIFSDFLSGASAIRLGLINVVRLLRHLAAGRTLIPCRQFDVGVGTMQLFTFNGTLLPRAQREQARLPQATEEQFHKVVLSFFMWSFNPVQTVCQPCTFVPRTNHPSVTYLIASHLHAVPVRYTQANICRPRSFRTQSSNPIGMKCTYPCRLNLSDT